MRWAIAFWFCFIPAAAGASVSNSVVDQLLAAVRSDQQSHTARELARMGVVAGSSLTLQPGIANPQAITDVIDDCYESAVKSGQVRNILGCYVMDRKVTDEADRVLDSQGRISRQTQERFNGVFQGLGVTNPVKTSIHNEFEAEWRSANKWLSSLTIRQAMACMEGTQTPGCP